ncbi:MAG: ABC transporter substrate-binding protein [Bacillota bacterium]|nr:ABC transporter substrate-binding protein [Bacillota bacterium]
MKKNLMTKLLLSVMALALVFGLSACGEKKASEGADKKDAQQEQAKDGEEGKEKEAEKELEKVSIVLDWYPNAIHCFLYNAIDKGYFAEEGIELEILFPAGTTDGISMPASGNADFGVFYMRQLIKARADENVPVKSIGAVLQEPVNIIMALKDKNIKSPKDLEGKKVGYAGMDISKQMVIEAVKADGADPNKIDFVDVGFELMSAMTTDQVDATIDGLENHELVLMQKQGLEIDYFSPNKYSVPEPYEMVIIASEDTLSKKPEMVAGFKRAIAKGFEDMKNDKAGSLDILFKYQNAENFPLDREVEEKSLDILLEKMEKDGAKFLDQKPEAYAENIKWMKEVGFLKNDIDPESLIYKAE